MSTSMVLDAVSSSNLPAPEKKTAIRKLYEAMTGQTQIAAVSHAREGFQVVRSAGEAAIIGGLLGYIDAEHGLDYGNKKIPIDGVISGLGFAASVFFANDPSGLSRDMQNIGSDALAILTYRKVKKARELSKGKVAELSSGTKTETKVTGDPILDIAADL